MKAGIDLGTSYSLIAKLDKKGTPVLLPDSSFYDVTATPSVVYVGNEGAFAGYMVDLLLEENPGLNVIRYFKRELGNAKPLFFDSKGNGWYPEAVTALLLKKMLLDAENASGEPVESAVITVPAHFNDLQRKAVINAASLIDLAVAGLIEEPVAAALHYGITHKINDQNIVVYDLGGGTFDASIVSMNETGLYTLAKDGLTEMGGKEFDEELGQIIINQFIAVHGMAPAMNALNLLQLRKISEELKIELCMPGKTSVRKIVSLGKQSLEIFISRRDFDVAIRKYIDQTIDVTLKCIDGAGMKETDVETVLMVGGSSFVPYIADRLKMIFKNQQLLFHEPMKAVAYGAALHAHQLSGEAVKFNLPPEFRGVTGYNVGIKTINQSTGRISVDTIIRKNMPLPAKATRTYYTTHAQQQHIMLDILQYRETTDQTIAVGQMLIGPLPSAWQNYAIEVTIEYHRDGTIQTTAYDPSTGVEVNQSFGNNMGTEGYLLGQKQLVENLIINNLGGA